MNGKKVFVVLLLALALAVLSGGCQAAMQPEQEPTVAETAVAPAQRSPTATPQAVSATETVPSTETPLPATTPSPEATAAAAQPMTPAEAGVALDDASPLISGVKVETVPLHARVPEGGPRNLLQPAHTVLHVAGYPLAESIWEPRIEIYPVEAYERLALDAERQVARLQALLAAWPDVEGHSDGLPFLPVPNAVQVLHAKVTHLEFANGEGVRYLTQYVQDTAPIVSNSLLYTFQGLTDDGQFYVSAVLPVQSEALPQDIPQAQEEGFDSFTYNFDQAGYEAYLAEQNAYVDGLSDDAFSPDLASADALMQSLDLSAYRGPAVEVWAPDVAPAPDQVLDDFLEEYLAAGGFAAGAHVDSPHLHPNFVAWMEEAVDAYRSQGIEPQGYDPLLMSQLGPVEVGDAGYGFDRLTVGWSVIEGDAASVQVQRHWHYTGAISPLRYSLSWSGERWQISGVNSILPRRQEDPSEPERLAQEFMASMVAGAGQFATPQEWLPHVDEALVAPKATVALCDGEQSWPVGFAIEGSFVQPAPLYLSTNVQQEAYVVVYRIEKGVLLTVHLVQVEGSWQISEVICGDTPEGRALAFYAWYLGAAAEAGETRWAERAPTIDSMNEGHYFVTAEFLRDARLRFQEDPYLPSARVPDRFTVRAEPRDNVVLVDLEFLGQTEAEVETVQLTLVQEAGVWLIDGLQAVTPES